MPGDHSHFPTFQKAADTLRRGGDPSGPAHWIMRNILNERSLLRLCLYFTLAVCLLHVATSRFVILMSPNMMAMYNRPIFGMVGSADESVPGLVLKCTIFLLGPMVAELSPLVAMLCLGGLAASVKRPDKPRREGPEVRNPRHDRPSQDEPSPPPTPPARHPLDPDPNDPPLEPRWPRTSPPSR
jgi:hypothetical protein